MRPRPLQVRRPAAESAARLQVLVRKDAAVPRRHGRHANGQKAKRTSLKQKACTRLAVSGTAGRITHSANGCPLRSAFGALGHAVALHCQFGRYAARRGGRLVGTTAATLRWPGACGAERTLHCTSALLVCARNGLTSAASALSSPRPHLHRDWGSPRPHCLHRGWGSPRPHLLRGWGSQLPLRLWDCCAEYSIPLLRHPSRLPLQPVNTAVASPHDHAALTR